MEFLFILFRSEHTNRIVTIDDGLQGQWSCLLSQNLTIAKPGLGSITLCNYCVIESIMFILIVWTVFGDILL